MTHSIEEHPEPIHLPKPTFWPLILGFGLMLVAFGFILLKWPLAGAGLLVMLAAVGGWLRSGIRERIHVAGIPVETPKFAMWCFIGTEVIIFGSLIARNLVVWAYDPAAHKILNVPLTSLNTFALLASSLAVVLGLSAIQRGNRGGLVRWLGAVILLGGFFLGVQAYEYSRLFREGLSVSSSQFGAAFFFLTGFHGLHVFVGILWCLAVLLRGLQGGFSQHEHLGVEIFGLYWHFVDVVWILIFTLVYLLP